MSTINSASTVLTIVSFTFFLVGIIGYNNENSTIRDIFWMQVKQSGSSIFFGLADYTIPGGSQNVLAYDGRSCLPSDFCHNCRDAGQSAFGLLIIALIFTTISFALSLAASSDVSERDIGISNIVMSFVAFATSLAGLVTFMSECFSEVKETFGQPGWGPGSVLTVIGVVFMGLVFLMQILAASTKPQP